MTTSPSRSLDSVVTEQTRSSESSGALGLMLTPGAVGAVFRITTPEEVTGLPDDIASWGVTCTVIVSPLLKAEPAKVAEFVPTAVLPASHS